MLNSNLMKYRLHILVIFLFAIEGVNLKKLAAAMAWTNEPAWLGLVSSLTLGSFLIIAIVASSFPNIEATLRKRFERAVVFLFMTQMALVSIESFLIAQTALPAEAISRLFFTPVEATLRVVALAESIALNISVLVFWQVVADLLRKEIEGKPEKFQQDYVVHDQANSNGIQQEAGNARV